MHIIHVRRGNWHAHLGRNRRTINLFRLSGVTKLWYMAGKHRITGPVSSLRGPSWYVLSLFPPSRDRLPVHCNAAHVLCNSLGTYIHDSQIGIRICSRFKMDSSLAISIVHHYHSVLALSGPSNDYLFARYSAARTTRTYTTRLK